METSIAREAVGVFRTRDALERAIKELLTAGFDRSDIDVLGDVDVVYRRLGTVVAVEELADVPNAPRHSLVTREDQRLTMIAVFQSLFVVGAFAGGAAVVASGGGALPALIVAAVAGLAAGLIGFGLARKLLRTFENGIEDNLAAGGVVVWVRVHDPEHEWRAQEILQKSGADAVRVHEIEIGKRTSDLPLGDIQPDPMLKHPTH
ncbi:hypothetical protein PRN20_02870 [Devosia sp. ZB163]|uniref:hypothetical protein n=1 Tax=Devosia sp. ZB163 TaxID=3025938 RepID=UPI002361DDF1|nr:hypothetical protein [Devosia sp. ZB163]MDC9822666.1 hypothetical protein [Devosia sp. ZB163]